MKIAVSLAALAGAALSVLPGMPARADNAAEIIGYHALCEHGDRRACVRFGMLIEHNRDRHAEWRRSHPEFFWYER